MGSQSNGSTLAGQLGYAFTLANMKSYSSKSVPGMVVDKAAHSNLKKSYLSVKMKFELKHNLSPCSNQMAREG